MAPVSSVSNLAEEADVVVSVCPPAAASQVAKAVAEAGFEGIYVDANAIAPSRTRQIAQLFDRFVDASIIGLPPTTSGSARLYLSGPEELAQQIQRLWAGSLFDVRVIGTSIGAASALKMAYAGWTKGSMALLFTVAAAAESEGVSDALRDEWQLSQPHLLERLEGGASGAAPKAWRFVGEMEEIATTTGSARLPEGFHRGAAEIYERLAGFKHDSPTVIDVLQRLLAENPGRADEKPSKPRG